MTATAMAIGALDGCHDATRPQVEAESRRIVAVQGDYTTGDPGEEAVEPLVVALRDSAGKPLTGVPVLWSAAGGGSLRQEDVVSDSGGLARAWWTLGNPAASQIATASALAGRATFRGWVRRSPDIAPARLVPLQLTTFEGSGQVVHPDVIFLPYGWDHGSARLAMAITPYPYGDPGRENPSLFTSNAGSAWITPPGATNPVQWPSRNGFLSDPALVYDASAHHLRMYYREVVEGQDVIRFVTTSDGVRWSAPTETIRMPSYRVISPSVVRHSGSHWGMWSIDGGSLGCANEDAHVEFRESRDGVVWSTPIRVALEQPGGYPWHIDVKWVASLHEYWALYNLKTPRSCLTPALYLATSSDGTTWKTYPNPVLQRGANAAFADVVYRSSFFYTKADDMVTFYFSGARWDGYGYVWSGSVQRRPRGLLFRELEAATSASLRPARRGLPSPEPSVGGPTPMR